MENPETAYCRFCAECKSSEKLLNLQLDKKKHEEILDKLTFLNAVYVHISNQDILPKTVCLVCYDALNKAYTFLEGVKRAQEVLKSLLAATNDHKCNLSDDDVFDFGDNEDVKFEPLEVASTCNADGKVHIKKEVKTEVDLEGESFNVQDIFNGTICNGTYSAGVTIYAKEVSDIGDRTLNRSPLLDLVLSKGAQACQAVCLPSSDMTLDEDSKAMIKSWADYPWLCVYCNIEFINVDMLRTHSKAVHGRCSAFMCIDCKVGRKQGFVSFIKHVRKHRKYLRKYCYHCDKRFNKTATLKAHIKEHFIKPQLPCHLCGEVMKNEEALNLHMHDYSSTKPSRRPRRKPGTPITLEDLTCALCKKVYKNPNSLRDHMKLHTKDRSRNYTCDRCGKAFFSKGTLTSHIMSHDKVRPHVCKICNKSFLFPNMLRRHVEMHSGVKPYSCEQCGRFFRLQYQLNAHKIVHTDAMPFICRYCNKAFRFKQILKNHERQHTGDKPYSCQHCSMEFTNWSNYNKHMKRRHGTDTSKKKITPEGVFPVNPETGQIIQVVDPIGTEEWKTRIMMPGKRGKKKTIKEETGA